MDIIKNILEYWGRFLLKTLLPSILLILAVLFYALVMNGTGIFGETGY